MISDTKIGTHADGVLHTKFSRKRATGDNVTDYTFTDTKCSKFLFPVLGGQLNEVKIIFKFIIISKI